jgi:CRISPR-associated protein Cas6
MNETIPEMTDLVFGLNGVTVPAGYAFPLWHEVARVLPWLEAEPLAGIVPLRTTASGSDMLLSHRAKLVLRVPAEMAQQARALGGQQLDIEGHVLSVGAAVERPLQAHPTLHAQLVAGAGEEVEFLAGMAVRLREKRIGCQWICGKRLTLQGKGGSITGYSLVVHDLKPAESLLLQRMGLGEARRYGCGIFVPYKAIPSLE